MSAVLFSRLARRGDDFATYCAYTASAMVAAEQSGIPVAAVRGRVDPNDVRHGKGSASLIARVQAEAIYLCTIRFGRSQRSLSRLLGITQQRVQKVIARVEDGREDGGTDRRLDDLELELMEPA